MLENVVCSLMRETYDEFSTTLRPVIKFIYNEIVVILHNVLLQ
jgi:hypothetical protein